jgi:hypothetical protein
VTEETMWSDVYDDATPMQTPDGEMELRLKVIYEAEQQVAKFDLYWFQSNRMRSAIYLWAAQAHSNEEPPTWMSRFTTSHATLCKGRSDAIRQGQAWYKAQVEEARQMLERLATVDKQFSKNGEQA